MSHWLTEYILQQELRIGDSQQLHTGSNGWSKFMENKRLAIGQQFTLVHEKLGVFHCKVEYAKLGWSLAKPKKCESIALTFCTWKGRRFLLHRQDFQIRAHLAATLFSSPTKMKNWPDKDSMGATKFSVHIVYLPFPGCKLVEFPSVSFSIFPPKDPISRPYPVQLPNLQDVKFGPFQRW